MSTFFKSGGAWINRDHVAKAEVDSLNDEWVVCYYRVFTAPEHEVYVSDCYDTREDAERELAAFLGEDDTRPRLAQSESELHHAISIVEKHLRSTVDQIQRQKELDTAMTHPKGT